MTMLILHRRKCQTLPFGITSHQHGNLTLKIHKAFQHRRLSLDTLPGLGKLFRSRKLHLPLAVIAKRRRFQDAHRPDLCISPLQIFQRIHECKWRAGNLMFPQKSLLPRTMLTHANTFSRGIKFNFFLHRFQGFQWNIFKLHRRHINLSAKLGTGNIIIKPLLDENIGYSLGRLRRRGATPDNRSKPHPAGIETKHAGELSATENSKRHQS